MNLHEYQAKNLFQHYQIPVPKGRVIDDLMDLESALAEVKSSGWVIKAQIHAGARGKAGGVQLVSD